MFRSDRVAYLTHGDDEVGVVVVDGGVLAGGAALDAHVGVDGDTSKVEAGYITLVTSPQHITEIALPREQKNTKFALPRDQRLLYLDMNTVN